MIETCQYNHTLDEIPKIDLSLIAQSISTQKDYKLDPKKLT